MGVYKSHADIFIERQIQKLNSDLKDSGVRVAACGRKAGRTGWYSLRLEVDDLDWQEMGAIVELLKTFRETWRE